jgi:uncharacterized membrane protein YdjX (TVP38/TMEM64 family)
VKPGVRWFLISVLLLAMIVVPFLMFGERFDQLGARMMRGDLASWPAAALISSFLALDIILPVPSSIVSTGAGVMFGFLRGTLVVWVGMMAGCLFGYLLGSRATPAARRFVGADGLSRAERVAADYGDWAIVICRPVPVLAEASVILAGLVHMPWRRFTVLTSTSNLGIAAAYAAIGAYSMSIGSFLLTFAGAIVLPGLVMLVARWRLGRGDR